jgi:hypothetical protein
METKLTLKLDKTVIYSAKKYAKKHNRSLSRMVENYFISLASESSFPKKHSPIVKSLTGILSENDLEQFALEDERARYILTKEI